VIVDNGRSLLYVGNRRELREGDIVHDRIEARRKVTISGLLQISTKLAPGYGFCFFLYDRPSVMKITGVFFNQRRAYRW
jgi:hypothetical protein